LVELNFRPPIYQRCIILTKLFLNIESNSSSWPQRCAYSIAGAKPPKQFVSKES
jgi:hypothetical protein